MLLNKQSSPLNLTLPLVEAPPIRVKQCRHGIFMYNAHDKYIGRSLDVYGELTESEIALFQSIVKPGMIVIDAGANIGTHTVSLAKAVGTAGRVIALEPQLVIFQMLCGNVALNGLENVITLWAAAGEKPDVIYVPHMKYHQEGNFGGLGLGEHSTGDPVQVQPLDSFNLPRCDFIKIDVEGMEESVLKGAEKTLQKFQPILYVENDRLEKSESLINHILIMDYRLYWDIATLYNPDNYFQVAENIFMINGVPISSFNMLGIPKTSDFPPPANAVEITRETAHLHPLKA